MSGQAHPSRLPPGRWWVLAAALTVQITVAVIQQGYPALAPFVKADLHLTLAQAGLFASIAGLGMFVGVMGAGWAVDRSGDRRVLQGGALVTGALALLAGLAPTYTVLILTVALVGIGAATPTPAGSSAVMSQFGRRQRGFVMSIRQTGVPLGGAIAALMLPLLAVSHGWRFAIVVAALTAIGGGLAAVVFYRVAGPLSESKIGPKAAQASMWTLVNRNLVYLGAYGFILVVGQFCIVTYVVLYLNHSWNVALLFGSLFLALTQVTGAIGRIFWGWVSDRYFGGRRKFVLAVISTVGAASVLTFGWLPASQPLVWVGVTVAVAGVAVIGWNGVWITLLAEGAPPGLQARAVASGLTVIQPAVVIGPWLFGTFVDATGSYRYAWTVLALLLLLAGLLVTRATESENSVKVDTPTGVLAT